MEGMLKPRGAAPDTAGVEAGVRVRLTVHFCAVIVPSSALLCGPITGKNTE